MRRLLVVLSVYYLIFGYAQLAAAWMLFPTWRPAAPELLALLVGPAAGWLVHQVRRNGFTRWLLRAVYLWVGLGFLLLCVVVPVHLLHLLGVPSGGAAVLLAALYGPLAVWSIVNAHRIVLRRGGAHLAETRSTAAPRAGERHPRRISRTGLPSPDSTAGQCARGRCGPRHRRSDRPDGAPRRRTRLHRRAGCARILRDRQPRTVHRKRYGLRPAGGAGGDSAARRACRPRERCASSASTMRRPAIRSPANSPASAPVTMARARSQSSCITAPTGSMKPRVPTWT